MVDDDWEWIEQAEVDDQRIADLESERDAALAECKVLAATGHQCRRDAEAAEKALNEAKAWLILIKSWARADMLDREAVRIACLQGLGQWGNPEEGSGGEETRDSTIFRMALREEPWAVGEHPYGPCPVCGVPWRPWPGSMLPCHAKCLLAQWAQDELLDSSTSVVDLAKRLGITASTVRASIYEARERRKGARPCASQS